MDANLLIEASAGTGKTQALAERLIELLRLGVPRRVFTLSQIKYCADRVKWVWDNRQLIGGL